MKRKLFLSILASSAFMLSIGSVVANSHNIKNNIVKEAEAAVAAQYDVILYDGTTQTTIPDSGSTIAIGSTGKKVTFLQTKGKYDNKGSSDGGTSGLTLSSKTTAGKYEFGFTIPEGFEISSLKLIYSINGKRSISLVKSYSDTTTIPNTIAISGTTSGNGTENEMISKGYTIAAGTYYFYSSGSITFSKVTMTLDELLTGPQVTLDANGGYFGSEDVTTLELTSTSVDDAVTSNSNYVEPTRANYTFNGWVDSEGNSATPTYATTSTTYYASWKISEDVTTYTVTFDDGTSTTNETVISGCALESWPSDPTKDGCLFAGWYDSEGNKYTSESTFTSDITLTAKFEEYAKSTTFESLGDGKITSDTRVGNSIFVIKAGSKSPKTAKTDGIFDDKSFTYRFSTEGNMQNDYSRSLQFTAKANSILRVYAQAYSSECDLIVVKDGNDVSSPTATIAITYEESAYVVFHFEEAGTYYLGSNAENDKASIYSVELVTSTSIKNAYQIGLTSDSTECVRYLAFFKGFVANDLEQIGFEFTDGTNKAKRYTTTFLTSIISNSVTYTASEYDADFITGYVLTGFDDTTTTMESIQFRAYIQLSGGNIVYASSEYTSVTTTNA